MTEPISPKVRVAHLQICANGSVAIPLSGKMEWIQTHMTQSSQKRINRILYRKNRIVQANVSNGEITLFIR